VAMLIILRALVNRWIDHLVHGTTGEVSVTRLRQLLLRSIVIAISAITFSIGLTVRSLIWYLDSRTMEQSIRKIDVHLVQQQENINDLFRINSEQHKASVRLTTENIELKNDVFALLRKNKQLSQEVKQLQEKLINHTKT
jgi:hypothetical protein